MPAITLRGRSVPYQVVRSKRNRYLRLTVTARGSVRVSMPPRYPAEDVAPFLREKGDWLLARLDEFTARQRSIPRLRYRDGARILFLGTPCLLQIRDSTDDDPHVRYTGAGIQVQLPRGNDGDGREQRIRTLLDRWYRLCALSLIPARLQVIGEAMRSLPKKVSIRRTKSCWGSCSPLGHLSFSQHLIMAPPSVIDYVIIHELAHLHELNHSRRYWKIVDRFCPDRSAVQAWLKDHTWLLDT